MNCTYCGNPAGFMKLVHKECENTYKELLLNRDNIIRSYISGTIDKKTAQNKIIEIVEHKYLQNSFLSVSERIKANEIIIREDSAT